MTTAIPAAGLVGLTALREAAAGSYQELMQMVEQALRRLLLLEEGRDVWPMVRALYPDSIVIEIAGKATRYSYSIGTDKAVTLSKGEAVEEAYVPAGTTPPASRGVFIEAIGGDNAPGSRYLIRVIRAGLSGNDNYYPDKVLREAVPLFEGARVFVKSDDEHLAGKGKDVRNLFGRITAPRFVEGKSTDQGEIQGELEVIEPGSALGTKLREAHARKMTDLFGFSIDAVGGARPAVRGNHKIREATRFTKVHSVDLIVEPGAGGGVIRLIEAKSNDPKEGEDMLRSTMISFIEAKKPALLAGVDKDKLTDDEVLAKYNEAQQVAQPQQQTGITQQQLDETIRLTEARGYARTAIAASNLPDAAKTKLQSQFSAEGAKFTEAQVDEAIKAEREYLANFTESGRVRGLGEDGFAVQAGESQAEKNARRLDAFFDPAHKDHRHAQSFKEAYVDITGDRRVTGLIEHADQSRFTEALGSAQLANVLGAALRRRMLADYNVQTQYDIWRRIANVVPVADFRTNERTRWGGYGDLPAVAAAGSYDPLASPSDEKASYAVSKRGGTEAITLEMIRNDDVGLIRQVPTKLSRAAKRTLGKFVLDFIRNNGAIYDTVALFHATHNNLGAAALDATTLAAGRLAMLNQTEAGSGDKLAIPPKSLLVPFQLEETAANLFRRNTQNDKTFMQSLVLDILPVWYWSDANDWALAADPNDIPGLEVGFLDGNEEPEIFVQDNPTVGSMFSNDQLTWKIRHIYGGVVTDYRGFYKAVVA